MSELDKIAVVRERLATAMAAGTLKEISMAAGIPQSKLREIATGKATSFQDAVVVYDAIEKHNGLTTNGEVKRRDLISGKEIEAKPLPSKRKVAQRGGRQIGAKAVKAKAEAESKPVQRRLLAGNLTKARRKTGTRPEPKPVARPKAAKAANRPEPFQHSDSQKITVLVDKNPHKEGFRNAKLFDLLKDGMTVKSFRQKVDDEGLEVRNWLNWSIGLKHISIK